MRRRRGRGLGAGGGRAAAAAAAAALRRRAGACGLLLGRPGRLLARQQALGVRVVHAAVLLQAVPQQQAAARGLHQARVDDHALQRVVAVDRQQVGHALRRVALVQRQPVGGRQHRRAPALARHQREVRGIARVAEHEVGEGEGAALAGALQRGVGSRRSVSTGQSSSGCGLFSSEKRAAQLLPAAAS